MSSIRSRFMPTVAALVASLVCMIPAWGKTTTISPDDEAAIKSVISKYQDALNTSSTDQAMLLYVDDGVFMRPEIQSAVGKVQLHRAYDAGFKSVTLHIEFTIHEIVLMSPEWAFVRTDSAGTNKINATGAMSAEGRKDLFIFHKDAGGPWKIARYSFSSTDPPPR
jgi:ketosteroid isomerase-like protein